MRRRPVNKSRSTKEHRGRASKTHKLNMRTTGLRGGIRL